MADATTTIPPDLEEAIAERVRWSEHDHKPRPCCVEAILNAVPTGWIRTDWNWQYLNLDDGQATPDSTNDAEASERGD